MAALALLALLDLALALGATLRLTRFIVADDVPGNWFIKAPLFRLIYPPGEEPSKRSSKKRARQDRLFRYWEGLQCPFCVSVYVAAFVTLTLYLAGGLGDASDWWRYPAGFLTLAWVASHVAVAAGDTYDPEG